MNSLPISVIVAAKNAERTIEKCLSSIRRNNPAEIIVVDGVSSDRTVEIAQKYTEKIFSDEGKEYNYAQQLGAERASQDYIAFIDSDIVLPEGTLAILLKELIESDCVNMAATVLPISLSTYWERATDWNNHLLRARRGVGGLQATVLRKDIVMKYQLNPFLKGASDQDFNMQMEEQGFRVGISQATVYHYHRVDLIGFIHQRFRYGYVTPRFIRKYGPWKARFWPPLVAAYWICVCLIKGKPNFMPYFIIDGVAQTSGLIKGFFELFAETIRKPKTK